MSRSTTHRYVITLVALGYLEQGASRKYRLGLRVTDLGMSALNSTGLREHAHPYLEELRQRTSYTVNLAVLDGADILYVDRARSFRRGQSKIDLGLHPGSRLPAYCTSMGKLLLGLPARGRAAGAVRGDQADQARPEHDHEQESAARRARRGRRRGLRRQRRRARARAALDRRPRPQRGPRGRRRRQPGRARLDDLAGGARRRARPAPRLHGRPHLRALRLPPRRRVLGRPLGCTILRPRSLACRARHAPCVLTDRRSRISDRPACPGTALERGHVLFRPMTVRRSIYLLCAPLLAVGVAACGTTVSTSSFKGEQHEGRPGRSRTCRADATALEAEEDLRRTTSPRRTSRD